MHFIGGQAIFHCERSSRDITNMTKILKLKQMDQF